MAGELDGGAGGVELSAEGAEVAVDPQVVSIEIQGAPVERDVAIDDGVASELNGAGVVRGDVQSLETCGRRQEVPIGGDFGDGVAEVDGLHLAVIDGK